ncbi:hypothetical protein CONLIGDRAFT_648974 [Coniochaeta ligniaria NRRL 30616]|uniref:Uncharacterized protein n=1 Tax=Coniochaeta ligniaria NRRL 30616 TaxID=1408157 RepID=A0A1J7J2Y6_9PEZI|nr:hypothetical protein CONLIGDRAFT_648974 [Coniochaeta ligniaria NRRL 30616]
MPRQTFGSLEMLRREAKYLPILLRPLAVTARHRPRDHERIKHRADEVRQSLDTPGGEAACQGTPLADFNSYLASTQSDPTIAEVCHPAGFTTYARHLARNHGQDTGASIATVSADAELAAVDQAEPWEAPKAGEGGYRASVGELASSHALHRLDQERRSKSEHIVSSRYWPSQCRQWNQLCGIHLQANPKSRFQRLELPRPCLGVGRPRTEHVPQPDNGLYLLHEAQWPIPAVEHKYNAEVHTAREEQVSTSDAENCRHVIQVPAPTSTSSPTILLWPK